MMKRRFSFTALLVLVNCLVGQGEGYLDSEYGEVLEGRSEEVGLWWASSGWKVGREKAVPERKGERIVIRAARNEAEAAQLVIRPGKDLSNLTVRASDLKGPGGSVIPASAVELLRVGYVHVTTPTDKSSVKGYWPDPLPPFKGGIKVKANENQPIWVRVKVPWGAKAGLYRGEITVRAEGYEGKAGLEVEVYNFVLPERMTCVTAFGFSSGNVFQYQGITDPKQKREVLEKYWANFSAHHISPYDPAPLDRIQVRWPQIKPPPSPWDDWENVRIVHNEKYRGEGALLIFDVQVNSNVSVSYKPLIVIPKEGLRFRFWFRTAVEGQAFNVALNHYDADKKWLWGKNNDMTLEGNGEWQEFDEVVRDFPGEAQYVRINARATKWTEEGMDIGLVWFDDISVTHPKTKEEYVKHGDFEITKRSTPIRPVEELEVHFDFSAWDRSMQRAIEEYHFNSFRLRIPGMGGGTFHARSEPQLLGFGEDDPEYAIMFSSYCRQMQAHLARRGWLDEAYIYWFDEPAPKDYAFVTKGFERLKQYAPDIPRMLTEQPEEGLLGGPEIWCVITPRYDQAVAEERRALGEVFWWYVCTGPKAPYCTLFIDHPGTEMRVWLWQTWKRKIEGILVWQTNYWTSPTAYPEHPQNPYADPMGWRTGYGTPRGEKRPWGNGDGRFIYPPESAGNAKPKQPILEGPVDSMRWEMLRDGIEDYEYLVMLRDLVEQHKSKLNGAQVKKYSKLLEVPEAVSKDMTHFTKDPGPLEKQRDRVARAIVELRRLR